MFKNVLSALIMSFALANLLFAQEAAKSSAKLYIDDTVFDFGYIYGGSVVSHSYVFHSRGTDSLKILNVKPGCGCTKAPLTKEVVAPGDSTEVELVYTSNKGVKGNFAKNATVTCNDADRGTFQLKFNGSSFTNVDSLTPLTLSEGELAITGLPGSKEVKLTVKNVSPNPVKIRLAALPARFLQVAVPEVEIKPGREKEIAVKVNSSVKDEQFKKSFTFVVDDQSQTRYTIPVSYSKLAEVSVIQPASSKSTTAGK